MFVWFLPFLCRWHYPWFHMDVCFSTCFELNEKWRWVSGELLQERPGLMCSQRTVWDPSSACLNWAARFVQTGVHLQQRALYKPLLYGPLERGHCRSFNMWITIVTHGTCNSRFKAVLLNPTHGTHSFFKIENSFVVCEHKAQTSHPFIEMLYYRKRKKSKKRFKKAC